MSKLARAAALSLALSLATAARAGELRGSPASIERQHEAAVAEHYEFAADSAAVQALVARERLVPVTGNADYSLSRQVSFPYARPEVVELLERLAAEFRAATGEPLVVTSLIRVTKRQPRNAHKLSVHPTGMAVDLHPPASPMARAWLERTLLSLEDQGLIDATRERRPRHYHVAVFPEAYRAWMSAQASPPGAPVVAAVANAVHSAARQPHGGDAMLLMLPVLFALGALAAHRRQGRTAGADAPRRPEGRH
jgi:hypothetical protein